MSDVSAKLARFKAAITNIYGPFDPSFAILKTFDKEYDTKHFLTNVIMKDPTNDYYAAIHANTERIKRETHRLRSDNKEKAQFEKEKTIYSAWLEKKKAHQQKSSMPFMDNEPRVSAAVIEYFDKKERDEKNLILRAQLDAMADDLAPGVDPRKHDHRPAHPPMPPPSSSHHAPPAHSAPAPPRSAASSTIKPKSRKEVSPPPRPKEYHPLPPLKPKLEPPATISIPKLPPMLAPPTAKPSLDLFGDNEEEPTTSSAPVEPVRPSESVKPKAPPKSPLLVESFTNEHVPKHIPTASGAVKRTATPPLSPTSAKRAKKAAKKEKKEKKEKKHKHRDEDRSRDESGGSSERHHKKHKKEKKEKRKERD